MPGAPRHSRPRTTRKPALRVGVPVLAAATLAGVAAAFVFLSGGSPGAVAAQSPHSVVSVTSKTSSKTSSLASDDMMFHMQHVIAARNIEKLPIRHEGRQCSPRARNVIAAPHGDQGRHANCRRLFAGHCLA